MNLMETIFLLDNYSSLRRIYRQREIKIIKKRETEKEKKTEQRRKKKIGRGKKRETF